ncbi:Uncharacterised protein [Mycobacteroides abscessus subsp. abscessus]|nr:Uncharacterised protein [Mycobacteroides abscessus subsp. abscessus]
MFEFLEDYRDVSVPSQEMDGVALTCRLGAGIADSDLPEHTPRQLREFWCRTSGGLLLVDEQLGTCGLTLHDPAEAKQRTQDRAEYGYELSESDWVLGEFVGDTDMLIVDAHDTVVISTVSYPRADWYTFASLSDVLSRFVQAQAEKYWESTAP